MKNTVRTTLGLLALATVLTLSCPADPRHGDVKVGGPIPEFQLPALDGEMVSSRSYLGGPVVLNFWATWCGPCIKEIPTLNTLAEDSRAQVVAISIDAEGESAVQPFVEKHGVGYTVLLDGKQVFRRFNGKAIPYTLVLDSSLQIVSFHRGYVSLRSLERDLRRAES